MQFANCWSHHFASSIVELTGWPVMKATDAKGKAVHYFNRDHDDRWVDVTGYVGVEELCRRYGHHSLKVFEDKEFKRQRVLDDDSMAEIMAEICTRQLRLGGNSRSPKKMLRDRRREKLPFRASARHPVRSDLSVSRG